MSKRNSTISNSDQLEPVGTAAELTSKSLSPELRDEPVPLSKQEVADLAYKRWVERGCPQGSPEEDWFEAENKLHLERRSS
jgi:hypothetical protein